MLAQRGYIYPRVFYTWSQSQHGTHFDPGFGKRVEWDIPLLEGYEFSFEENIAKDPGSHHYKGLDNPALIQNIKQWKPDAVLVITWAHKSHLACMRYFHNRVPVLFRGDSTLLNEQPGVRKIIRKLFLQWVYRHVDVGMYVGTNNKQYYLRHGLRENELQFTPHAIDNSRFANCEAEAKEAAAGWRFKLGIPTNGVVFLYAGKLEPVKNPGLLLDAFKSFSNSDTHLVWVGNGPLEKELKERSRGWGNIHFIDFQNQSQMPAIYHLADVFVLPSRSETWGLAINEAMACNRPVLVSSRCGAAIDLVQDGGNGYIFQSGNKSDLVEKMERLYSQQHHLREMGNQSFSRISRFSFENVCEAFEKVLC